MAKQTPNLKLYKVDPETDGDMSFNIETMLNENWDKVDEGFEQLQDNLSQQESDYVRKPGYSVTSGTGNAYTVTTDPAPAAYVDGMGIVIRANRANTGAATLNWNGLGAVPIVDAKGNPVTAGKIPNGARLTLRYSASTSNFQLQGEGGEYGTATQAEVMQGYTIGTENGIVNGTLSLSANAAAGDVILGQTFYNTNPKNKITGTLTLTGDAAVANVLTGKTFYTTNPKTKLTGTMPNRGAVTNTIIAQGGQYTIPAGYHNGSGKVTANFPNLIPGNVRQGVNIGGVVGNYIGEPFGNSKSFKYPPISYTGEELSNESTILPEKVVFDPPAKYIYAEVDSHGYIFRPFIFRPNDGTFYFDFLDQSDQLIYTLNSKVSYTEISFLFSKTGTFIIYYDGELEQVRFTRNTQYRESEISELKFRVRYLTGNSWFEIREVTRQYFY